MKYILASASPRRKELMEQAGFRFEVIPSMVEERITKTTPSDVVMELAFQKAQKVFESYQKSSCGQQDYVVIGADTIVVYRNEILGKPANKSEAFDMLSMLSDRTHQVYTGVSLIYFQNEQIHTNTFYESTDVTFCPISREDLHSYIESGDPLDKAGAYGIQGSFAIHVKCIKGDYNNVVGLPICRLYQELKKRVR